MQLFSPDVCMKEEEEEEQEEEEEEEQEEEQEEEEKEGMSNRESVTNKQSLPPVKVL